MAEFKKIKLLEDWMGDKKGAIKPVGVMNGNIPAEGSFGMLHPGIADDLINRGVAEEYKEPAKRK